MTYLTYSKAPSGYECTAYRTGGRKLSVTVKSAEDGEKISLAGKYYPVKNSVALLDTVCTEDGIYPLILHKKGLSISLGEIELRGKITFPVFDRDEAILALRHRCASLAEEALLLSERISALEECVFRSVTF